eukprot:2351390-Prymnesium_polylepis.1
MAPVQGTNRRSRTTRLEISETVYPPTAAHARPRPPPTQLSCSRPATHCARASTDNAEPEYDLEA